MTADKHLTEPNPELAKLIAKTPHGMMHWSGTGPAGTTCGQCAHYGYAYKTAKRDYVKQHACALFWKHMRTHPHRQIPPSTDSCKYFEKGK
jgi:hypothetical protein